MDTPRSSVPRKKKSMARQPSLISLYSGAGGLDYGFEAAGFRTAAAVEIDSDCCETLRKNRDWPVLQCSIFDVATNDLLEVAGLSRGEVDLVIGGPPCQPFSKSGYWASGDTKRLEDPRAGTLGAFMRVVEEALPRVFVMENVEGLAYSEKNEGLAFVLHMIDKINRRTGARYAAAIRVLCAADFGVPQVRHRLFVVCAREGQLFNFPAPTHGGSQVDSSQPSLLGLQRHRSAWDALGDLEPSPDEDLEMRGKWADLLPSIPEGQNYLWHTERGGGLPLFGWRRRFWSFLLKLAKDRPSWTSQAQSGPGTGPFHWSNRRLSMRELCRLQTFPDDVRIVGGYRSIHRQVGNAVPSLLGEVVGRAVRTQLLGDPTADDRLHLLPPDRSPAPPAEPVAQVPRRFRMLAGRHAAHPGTGKGYRAGAWSSEAD